MRTDTKATRKKIIAAAERLFAERGVDAVSLNEINTASGQKNKSGLHYHFGNKAGLIQAIIDKHAPGIAERRQQLLDGLPLTDDSIQGIVSAFVLPVAEKLHDPDGGICYIRMNSQLVDNAEFGLLDLQQGLVESAKNDNVLAMLTRVMPDMPTPLVTMRLLIANGILFHSLADYSRLIEQETNPPEMENSLAFTYNLVDVITSILSMQPSRSTLGAMAATSDLAAASSINAASRSAAEFELDGS